MKIFCIGRNYSEHSKELNNPIPSEPLVFMKPPTAICKDNFMYIPDFTNDLHHEIEIVLRIAKNGKAINPNFAHKYIDKLTLGIDFTARDLQERLKTKGHPWEIAKAFDNSAVLGEWIDFDPITFPNISFSLFKNEKLQQSGASKDMIFSYDVLIAQISNYFTLQKGDCIFTGTPAGVSAVKSGDHLIALLDEKKLLEFNIR